MRVVTVFSAGVLLLAALLTAAVAEQDDPAGAGDAPVRTDADADADAATEARELWQRSLEDATDLWERSAETADRWWQRSREATAEAWEGAQRTLNPPEPDALGRVWRDLAPRLEETLELQERRDQLPRRAWFGRDQADADADINDLLGEAVDILSTSPVQRYRERIAELRREIAAARADIDRFRRERIAAPSESLIATTVADYEQRIAEREADIRRHQAELDRIKAEFVSELRGMGLDISDEQVDLLLATVVGDNLIDLGIVFDNVKAITLELEQLVRDSGEDLDSARRYYGMYVILLRALARMHSDVARAIDERYLPEIDAIAERAARLSEQTRALIETQPERAELLRNNLAAQQLTIEAAEVYRRYLREQRQQVEAARDLLQDDIETAWNTYETVRVSGELIDLVQSSQRLLDGLLDREVPPLRPFENLQMQRELEKLTRQLRRDSG